jgi:protein-tyrosine phosphatase
MKVLMVCLGNICRSPLAHGILNDKLKNHEIFVDSAGTGNYHVGSPPDPRSIEVARQNGIDISHQRARQFTTQDFDDFDRIYVMDEANLADLKRLVRHFGDLNKLFLFMAANPKSVYKEVPDPYYGDSRDFKKVFELVDETCEIIAEELKSQI